ncbi:MAG TPA: hypothetical protein VF603_10980 [Allosphingosinicella sp.]|jgi:hypothetical protein
MNGTGLALTLFAFAAAAQAPAQPPQPPPPAGQAELPTAAQIAESLQQHIPIDLPHGVRATRIASEGDTLVWTIDVPAAMMEGHSVADATAPLRAGFCSGPGAAIFLRGISLRIDVGVGGGPPARGELITSCPDAQ